MLEPFRTRHGGIPMHHSETSLHCRVCLHSPKAGRNSSTFSIFKVFLIVHPGRRPSRSADYKPFTEGPRIFSVSVNAAQAASVPTEERPATIATLCPE